MRRTLLPLLFLIPAAVWAVPSAQQDAPRPRHYIMQTDHVLRPSEQEDLAARGVEIQHVLPGNRYLIRTDDAERVENDVRVRSLSAYGEGHKIHASAYRAAARGSAFVRVRLVFHDDVSVEDAQAAVTEAGGAVERQLSVSFEVPHGFTARIPATALRQLANDDRVFAVFGPPLHARSLNSDAAVLSSVTPLYSAPYNLSGAGVSLSEFEGGPVDAAHPEFIGRINNHLTGSPDSHATHVAGTMMASGLNALAKGMAPNATTLHVFSFNDDFATILQNKQSLPQVGALADNNSWGFPLGWQPDGSAPNGEAWWGDEDFFGAYDASYAAPYDKVARSITSSIFQAAGNDGFYGHPDIIPPWFQHGHIDENGNLIKETFCYSQDGSGTDCPTPTCTTGRSHCEIVHHAEYGPFGTIGLLAADKNIVAVGAVDTGKNIASFSSRGPTKDGRVKPDVVAMGVSQFSTVPGGGYSSHFSGTSMSTPVATGIAALLIEQWRSTFHKDPSAEMVKMLMIAGADDLGNPGPDYTFGFGLVDAKNSVDLIRADNGTGARIRSGDIAQGQQIETTFFLPAAQNVRVVLGWSDPEVVLAADELADKTLVNDLDLKVIDPTGSAVLPYVLNKDSVDAPATRAVNTIDNTEEVEIKNATAGTYRVVINGTRIAAPPQSWVLIANAALGTAAPVCSDAFEPNDTPDQAFTLASGATANARFCSQSDVDYFKLPVSASGTATASVTATDTAVKVTLLSNGQQLATTNVAAGGTSSVSAAVSGSTVLVRVEPAGTVGSSAAYTLSVTYPFSIPPRHRGSQH